MTMHEDVFNILLQVLDDGKLTDSHGKTVHFENTVIIMTSNAGTDFRNSSLGFIEQEKNIFKDKINSALKQIFKPEFLNRDDEIVTFNQLSKDDIKKIVDITISDLNKDISEKNIKINLHESAKDYLAEKGYDIKYGARPLKRIIQKEVEGKLADMYINDELKDNCIVTVSFDNNMLSFNKG